MEIGEQRTIRVTVVLLVYILPDWLRNLDKAAAHGTAYIIVNVLTKHSDGWKYVRFYLGV